MIVQMIQIFNPMVFLAISLAILPMFLAPGAWILKIVLKRFPLEDEVLVVASAILTACLGYGIFWVYFFNFIAGRVVATTLLLFSLYACIRLRKLFKIPEIREPLLIWFGMLLFQGGLLGVYAQGGSYFYSAGTVLTHDLPNDNWLPFEFARCFFYGRAPKPFVDHWLSSDRPPLQAAIFLIFDPLASIIRRNDFFYQILSHALQLLWVPTLWTLARKLKFPHQVWLPIWIATATSSFFLINSIYVWPKMLAASLTIIGILFVFFRTKDQMGLILSAIAFALSYLSHGSVVFSWMALPILFFWIRRHRDRWKFSQWGWMGVIAVSLLIPWSLYQKFYDPPGNRLLKWHLAGVEAIDSRGALETLRAQYSGTPWSTLISNRVENFQTVFTWKSPLFFEGISRAAAQSQRFQDFFFFFNELGLLCIGFLALFLRQRNQSPTRAIVGYALGGIFVWCLLLFEGGGTTIHQGTYVTNILLYFGLVAMMSEFSKPLLWIILSWRTVYFLVLWIVFPMKAFDISTLLWAIFSGLGIFIAFWVSRFSQTMLAS